MKEWVFSATSREGQLVVSMYEVTEGKSNHERETVRQELDVAQMILLQEELNRALSYHLRMMV